VDDYFKKYILNNNDVYNLFVELEGKKNEVYNDSGGFPTIGIGHKLTQSELTSGKIYIGNDSVEYDIRLSDNEIDRLFWQDLEIHYYNIKQYVFVKLNPNEMIALISFCYNIGINAFKNSTLLKLLNQSHYNEVPDQMRRWKYCKGEIIQGLINRREKEIAIWNKEYKNYKLDKLLKIKSLIEELINEEASL